MPTIAIEKAEIDLTTAQNAQMNQHHRLDQTQKAVDDVVTDFNNAIQAQIDNATNPQQRATDIALVDETQGLMEKFTRDLYDKKINYDSCRLATKQAEKQLHKVRATEQQCTAAEADARERATTQRLLSAEQQQLITNSVVSQLRAIPMVERTLMASEFIFSPVQSRQIVALFKLTEQNVKNFLSMAKLLARVYGLNQNSLIVKLNELQSLDNLIISTNQIHAHIARQTARENTHRTIAPTKKRLRADKNNLDNATEYSRTDSEPNTAWQQHFNQIAITFIMNKIVLFAGTAEIAHRHAMINHALYLGLSSNKIIDCFNTKKGFENLQLEITKCARQPASTASLTSASQLSNSASVAPLPQSSTPTHNKRQSVFHVERPLAPSSTPQPTPAKPSPTVNTRQTPPSPAHFSPRSSSADLDASLPNLPSPDSSMRHHSTPAAHHKHANAYNNGLSPLTSPPPFNTPRAKRYEECPVHGITHAINALSPTPSRATQQSALLPTSPIFCNTK